MDIFAISVLFEEFLGEFWLFLNDLSDFWCIWGIFFSEHFQVDVEEARQENPEVHQVPVYQRADESMDLSRQYTECELSEDKSFSNFSHFLFFSAFLDH